MGLEHYRLYIYGKPIEISTDHQVLEPLIKKNRSNKTYSARLPRWLDRFAHFDMNNNHIAGKHLAVSDYLSRHPSTEFENTETYDEESLINCIVPFLNFTSKYESLKTRGPIEAQERHQ